MQLSRLVAVLALVATSGGIVSCGAGDDASSSEKTPLTAQPLPSQPSPTPTLSPEAEMARERWGSMDLEEQAASLLMLYYPGTDPAATAQFVRDIQPGGLILMGDNIPADESQISANIAQWNEASTHPLLIGIDEEGGTVTRLPSDVFPAAPQLRDGPAADTTQAFEQRSELLKELGINVNFGIIADTTADPSSFIWPRVLGSTPQLASQNVAAAVQGESGNVASTLKHFPGHGLTAGDSHTSIPSSDVTADQWRELALPPFQSGVDAGAEFVMIGHLRFPQIADEPASLSPQWHEILRDEVGFEAVIITDSMSMLLDSGVPEYSDPVRNAIDSIAAGSTMVLMVGSPGDTTENAHALVSGIADAVRSGEIDRETFDSAGVLLMEHRIRITEDRYSPSGVEG